MFTKTTGTDHYLLMLKLLLHQEAKPTSLSNLASSKLEPSLLIKQNTKLTGLTNTKLPPLLFKQKPWLRDGRTTKTEKKFNITTGTYVKAKSESDSTF